MKTIESLKLLSTWVEPEFPVRAARMLLEGYGVSALPVCESGFLLGVVTAEAIARAADDDKVRPFVVNAPATVAVGAPIRSVVDVFLKKQVDFAPVVQNSHSLGMVTARMLLAELSRSYDPMTGLSWADYLREWGVENLANGREVTILFIDLDDFGQYNKLYGHVVGDKVIQAVANMLELSLDPERDVLVRYGGDEFAIGTLRDRDEADALAEQLEEKEQRLSVPESPRAVTFSVGVFGGKRGKNRPNEHYQSALDNLINLASKAAQARKKSKKTTAPETQSAAVAVAESEVKVSDITKHLESAEVINLPITPAPTPVVVPKTRPVRIVEVMADEHSQNPMVTVSLSHGENVVNGVSAYSGGSVAHTVAVATAKALDRAFLGTSARVKDVRLTNAMGGKRVVSVTIEVVDERGVRVGTSAMEVLDEINPSVAAAALDAFFLAE